MTVTLRLLPAAAAVLIAFVACGEDGGETPTPSPALTASPSPSPAPTEALSPTAESTTSPAPEAPHAAPIEVGPGQEALGGNVLSPVLAADGVFNMDPIDLAADAGIVPPSCAELVFYFSWQVRQPFPPDIVVDLEFYWTRMGGTELVAEGTSGQASRGCGLIQMVNNSDIEVMVELRYVIARILA